MVSTLIEIMVQAEELPRLQAKIDGDGTPRDKQDGSGGRTYKHNLDGQGSLGFTPEAACTEL